MNEALNRWVFNSVSKHFRDGLSNVIVQGDLRVAAEPAERYEVRFLGPDWSENGSEYIVKLTVNVVIRSANTKESPTRHNNRIGAVLPLLSCIRIKRYGAQPTDDQTSVDVFTRMGDVRTTPFDVVDPVSKIMLTTLECDFVATVSKDAT